MKVSKKVEILARALCYQWCCNEGLLEAQGADYTHDWVDRKWRYYLSEAKQLNDMINIAKNNPLIGLTDGTEGW